MKVWDGTTTKTFHKYPVSDERPLYIDEKENILYVEDGEYRLWCAAHRLAYHLTRLYQIGVINQPTS